MLVVNSSQVGPLYYLKILDTNFECFINSESIGKSTMIKWAYKKMHPVPTTNPHIQTYLWCVKKKKKGYG